MKIGQIVRQKKDLPPGTYHGYIEQANVSFTKSNVEQLVLTLVVIDGGEYDGARIQDYIRYKSHFSQEDRLNSIATALGFDFDDTDDIVGKIIKFSFKHDGNFNNFDNYSAPDPAIASKYAGEAKKPQPDQEPDDMSFLNPPKEDVPF